MGRKKYLLQVGKCLTTSGPGFYNRDEGFSGIQKDMEHAKTMSMQFGKSNFSTV
jgi:hypothetical protein